jgi:hypothetical protein
MWKAESDWSGEDHNEDDMFHRRLTDSAWEEKDEADQDSVENPGQEGNPPDASEKKPHSPELPPTPPFFDVPVPEWYRRYRRKDSGADRKGDD